mgnify:CR=1 FL=1
MRSLMSTFAFGAGLGHFDFSLEIVPRFVAEPQRDLVAEHQHLVENRTRSYLSPELSLNYVKLFASGLAFWRFPPR